MKKYTREEATWTAFEIIETISKYVSKEKENEAIKILFEGAGFEFGPVMYAPDDFAFCRLVFYYDQNGNKEKLRLKDSQKLLEDFRRLQSQD